jgi:malate synthase
MPLDIAAHVQITGPVEGRAVEILTPEALAFVADLHRRFDSRRRELLALRVARQARFDAGEAPDFLAETADVRAGDWQVAPIPADLQDRRVEITGPVDRKMIINALNCGAKVFMADFEDATSPTWANLIEGQVNLKDRWAGALTHRPKSGKSYALGLNPAVLKIRPRGWHLPERHMEVDGLPVSGRLFDFGLYFFHNAKASLEQGFGPLFLPAQDGEPSGGPPVERGLRPRPGGARHSERHDQGHGPDRDHAGRLRDGRDPLSSCATIWPASTAAVGTTSSRSSSAWAVAPEF